MSDIVVTDRNVSWRNVKVDQYTNLSKGSTYITVPGTSTAVLASSATTEWTLTDLNQLTRLYNAANNLQSTIFEVERLFFEDGIDVFNEIRADRINQELNYPDINTYRINATNFFNDRIPGTISPKDQRVVSSRGFVSTENPFENQVRVTQTPSRPNTAATASDGVELANGVTLRAVSGSSAPSSSFGGTLRYPARNLSEFGIDYMSFQAYEYSRSDAFRGGGSVGGLTGGPGLGAGQGEVQLPMPMSIADNNGVGWGPDRINPIQAGLAEVALNTMDGAISGATGDGNPFDQVMGALSGGTEEFMTSAKNLFDKYKNNANMTYALKAHFAGQAVGANVFARATGSVLNPNLELLFNGPTLRSFNFSFPLTPRDEGEASSIKQIIKYFKKNMAVQASGDNLFLYTPNVFQLKYIYNGGGQHPFLNQFKPCALVNFNVSYTPANSYMTYKNGSMTQYTLSMTFSELQPIFKKDQDSSGGTGF